MKKRLLAILLTVCMVLSMAPAALAADSVFTDVKADDWYADEIKWVYDEGLMDGVGGGSFAPETTTTRAMLVTILWRLEGEPAPAGTNPFTDVPAGEWYTEAVVWAAENKIVEGYGANLFGPTDELTREQMVTILYRYAQYKEYDVETEGDLSAYTDADKVADWAQTAMLWAIENGLINGVTDTTLAPQGDAIRGQLAAILYRLNENVIEPAEKEEEPVTPPAPPAPPVIIPTPTPPAVVTAITVNSSTHKIAYKVGDTLDVTDLTILVDMSYGSDPTVDVTAGMVTGFDSSAVAANQALTITYEGKTTTYTISIAKADGPAAPTGLSGAGGKITGTTTAMEYSATTDFASTIDCTDSETTGMAAGTYYVRVKATATHEAGAYATVIVSPAEITGISVNSSTHKTAYKVGDTLDVTGLTILVDMSYGSDPTVEVNAGMVSGFNSEAVAGSQTLTITYEGKTATYNISIAKADGPEAPIGLTNSNDKIIGTTAAMEYSTSAEFTSATACADTETTGLATGTYYVRVAATDTHEAGAYATVSVHGEHTYSYTANEDGTHDAACTNSIGVCANPTIDDEDCSYLEGTCEYCGYVENAVAKVGTTYFATFHEAIKSQASKTGEVQLLSDIDLSAVEAQAAIYWPITINGAKVGGGNYKIIGRTGSGATFATALAENATEWVDGTLTFKNLDIEVAASGQGLFYVAHAKDVVVDNCHITMGEGVTHGDYVMKGASGVYQLTLTNSSVTGNWRYGFIDVNAESEVTITGNTFDFVNEKYNNTTSRTGMISLKTKKVDGVMVDVEGASDITITGNTFKNANRVLAIDSAAIKADELTYTGNTFVDCRFAFELDSTKDTNKYNYALSGNTGTIRIQDASKSGNKFDDVATAVAAKIVGENGTATYFATFHEAIKSQASKTGEVQLLSDIDLSAVEAQAAIYWPITVNGAKAGGGNYKIIGRTGTGSTFATALAQNATEWADGTLTFKNLDIEVAASGRGLFYVAHAKAVAVDNCHITMGEGVTYGDYVMKGSSATYQLTLTNSSVTGNWRYGFINVNAESEVTITGNTFDFVNEKHNNTTSRTGMISLETPKNNEGDRVDVEGASDITITGNTFKNANRVLAIDSAIIKADELTYSGNTFVGCRFAFELDSTKDGNKYDYDLSGNTGVIRIQDASKSGNKFDDVATAVSVRVVGVGYYPDLQTAVDAAQNGATVILMKDLTENVVITQKAGVSITIDGDNHKMNGKMTVFGNGKSESRTEALTIKNINFIAAEGADSCIVSPDNEVYNLYSYSHNVTVDNCTFTDSDGTIDCAAVRHSDGGDENWTITNCVVDNTMHSLIQTNNVEGQNGLVISGCEVYSKNGANLNCTTKVQISGCTFDVKGYCVRFGVNSGGNPDATKTFSISNSTLKSECGDGDAIIIFRTTAVNATLTLTSTTLTGTTQFSGNTSATTITIDGVGVN